jgi:hypothetical protein
MTTKKAVNYSPENIVYMTGIYQAATTEAERKAAMETIATELNKTVASVRSKLSFEQVYIPLVATPSKGKRVTKADLLAEIADTADHDNDQFFDSLSGANASVLRWIMELQADIEAQQALIAEPEMQAGIVALDAREAAEAAEAAEAESDS